MVAFRNLANAEESGSEWLQSNLHAANTPLWIALAISAVLAFGIALALTIDPKRRLAGVGLPLSIGIPFLAVTPAVFLGAAESKIREIISGNFMTFSATDYALTVPSLLMLAIASGLLVLALDFPLWSNLAIHVASAASRGAFSTSRILYG